MSFTLPTEKPIVFSVFQKYDANNSGTIGLKELSQLLSDLGFRVETNKNGEKEWRELKKQEVKAIATLIDKDVSKSINFEEFWTWWLKLSGDGFNSLTKKIRALTNAYEAFVKYDVDKSGFLSFPTECKQFYEDLFSDQAEISFDDISKELDKNGDGKIYFQELISTMKIL